MAYDLLILGGGREAVRCTSGETAHILTHLDGTWTVEEDPERRIFSNHGEALNRAREIARDPD
jgi:hypothetical protein